MIVRHKWEMENINVIIEKYRKPLEVREKALEKKFARIEEIKKRLEERSKAIASLGSLPPPAEIVPDSDSDGEREATELGNIETSLGTHSCNVYSMPK